MTFARPLLIALLCVALGGAASPTTAPAPAATQAVNTNATLDDVRDYVVNRVAEGFDTRDEIVNTSIEVFEDTLPADVLRANVPKFADDAIAKHRAAQKTWVGKTDCERLDEAFAALEAAGIVARQNFSDCQTCGQAEIGEEIEQASKKGAVRGFTFYHWQDTDGAIQTGKMYLTYGDVDGTPAGGVKIGKEVAKALRAAGLTVNWNETFEQRIGVKLDWKKRRNDD